MSLEEGCKVAVETCMDVKEWDKVVIVCDEGSERIGRTLRQSALEITPHVRFFKLEVYGDRPIKELPKPVKEAATEATVTFWTAWAYEGELETTRGPFIDAALVGGRHAHMVNITEEVMEAGMSVDYTQIKKFTDALYERIRNAKKIKVTNPQGTDLEAKFSDVIKWIPSSGICHEPGHWLNLPDGEIFTSPASIEGTLIADGVLGDYLGHEYTHSVLQESPVTIEIKSDSKSYCENLSTENEDLERDLKEYLEIHECSKRVGEFGLGTNIFQKQLIDNMLLDEKYPGVHVAFGDPMHGETNAGWTCPQHLDMILTQCDVWVDDEKIMEDSEYLFEP